MGEYTKRLNDELWRSWGEDDATYTDDYSPVVDFLNSDDFRSFGDGLS